MRSFVRKQRCGRCQRSHQLSMSHSIQTGLFKMLSIGFVSTPKAVAYCSRSISTTLNPIFSPFLLHFQTETIFEVLKAHMKRAPSLKGAALVKLSQLKIQAYNWPVLRNLSEIAARLDQVEITSDDWFRNVLNIYKAHKTLPKNLDLSMNNGGQTA